MTTGPVVRPDVDEAALRVLAEALGFDYESPVAPVNRQGITIGDVRRALAKHPTLSDAVARSTEYGVVFNGHLLPGRSELLSAEQFVQIGNPDCTYQIVRIVPTPLAVGYEEYLRRQTGAATPEKEK